MNKTIAGARRVRRLSLSPDGRWVAAGHWRGDAIRVWKIETGEAVASLQPGPETAEAIFSPDGRWLVTGTSLDYRLWRVGSWEEAIKIDRPPRFSSLPGIMAFSRDSSLIALVLDQSTLQILRSDAAAVVATLEMVEPQAFSSVRFSPDRTRLAAGTSANRVQVWEMGRILEELRRLGLDRQPSTGDRPENGTARTN